MPALAPLDALQRRYSYELAAYTYRQFAHAKAHAPGPLLYIVNPILASTSTEGQLTPEGSPVSMTGSSIASSTPGTSDDEEDKIVAVVTDEATGTTTVTTTTTTTVTSRSKDVADAGSEPPSASDSPVPPPPPVNSADSESFSDSDTGVGVAGCKRGPGLDAEVERAMRILASFAVDDDDSGHTDEAVNGVDDHDGIERQVREATETPIVNELETTTVTTTTSVTITTTSTSQDSTGTDA